MAILVKEYASTDEKRVSRRMEPVEEMVGDEERGRVWVFDVEEEIARARIGCFVSLQHANLICP
jgi:hypothetical protein